MKTALVAGASGMVGGNLIDRLLELDDWQVVGIARRTPRRDGNRYRHVTVDMTDRDACRDALAGLPEVTHVFYAGRNPRPDAAEEAKVNLGMLANVLDAVEPVAGGLSHVQLVHGMKWYGAHLGPYSIFAREDEPRQIAPNFYYDQQDYIAGRQAEAAAAGRGWTWTSLRPHLVCGYATGYPHNILAVIAAYAAIARELDLPLYFPGTQACFEAINQATDVGLLAEAMIWAATAPTARNEAFNVLNGDFWRWADLWPIVADNFGMRPGPVRTVRLTEAMADKDPVWERLQRRHGLAGVPRQEVCNWGYGDGLLHQGWHNICSTHKLHRAGFHTVVDTPDMLLRVLGHYRDNRVIP